MRQYYSYYVYCGYSSRCIRYTKTLTSLQKHSVMRPVKLASMSDPYSLRYASRQQLGTLYRTTYYSQRRCCTGYRSCNCQSCGLACISCSSGCCRKLKRCLVVSTMFITVVAVNLSQIYICMPILRHPQLFAVTVTQIIHALHRILVCVPLAGRDLTVI